MKNRIAIGLIVVGLLLNSLFWSFRTLTFHCETSASLFFGVLMPVVCFWVGGILLVIKPKDMSVAAKKPQIRVPPKNIRKF